MPAPHFVISSRCFPDSCVGVKALDTGTFAVTNTSVAGSPVVTFTVEEWDAFIEGVKDGEFDTPRLQRMLQDA